MFAVRRAALFGSFGRVLGFGLGLGLTWARCPLWLGLLRRICSCRSIAALTSASSSPCVTFGFGRSRLTPARFTRGRLLSCCGVLAFAFRCLHQTAVLGTSSAGIARINHLRLRCAGGILMRGRCIALRLGARWAGLSLLARGLLLLRRLIGSRFAFLTLKPLGPLAVTISLTLAVLAFLIFTTRINFALRLIQKTQIMLSVLLKILSRDPVVAQLRIASQLVVFINDLLRRPAHLALRAGAVEDAINNINPIGAVPVRLGTRT